MYVFFFLPNTNMYTINVHTIDEKSENQNRTVGFFRVCAMTTARRRRPRSQRVCACLLTDSTVQVVGNLLWKPVGNQQTMSTRKCRILANALEPPQLGEFYCVQGYRTTPTQSTATANTVLTEISLIRVTRGATLPCVSVHSTTIETCSTATGPPSQ